MNWTLRARFRSAFKPTIIKWNRRVQSEIASQAAAERRLVQHDPATTAADETAGLNRKLTALKQELLSRALHDVPTAALETLIGEARQRLETLRALSPSPPETADSSSSGTCSDPIAPQKNI